MTIKEKINYLEAVEKVLDFVDEQIRWNSVRKYDENENPIKDNKGNDIWFAPDPVNDEWEYKRYIAFNKIKADIEKLADKL